MAIRVGVIGAGIMGADHARIIAGDIPGAVLAAVCDADAARARKVAAETGAAETFTDPNALIASPRIDAVLIASPDATHAPLAIACIEAGKPVLCEKPLAPKVAECLQVLAAEQKAGKRLVQVGFMRRFDPSYTEMKATLAGGGIGRALMLHNFHRNVDAPAGFTADMAITNSAPHEFDVARFVLDADYAAISAFAPAGGVRGGVGPVFMVLETTARQLVNIEVNNNAAYGYDVRGELVAEQGSVFLNAPIHTRVNASLQSAERYPADWRPRFAEAYRLQNKAWIRAIASSTPSSVGANAWDGTCAAIVAEAGVKALAEGRRVKIEMSEKPALYR
jgi:myo-inositol 2-dehydrogenase/D-chiro-inositol 1-dehydrogenase